MLDQLDDILSHIIENPILPLSSINTAFNDSSLSYINREPFDHNPRNHGIIDFIEILSSNKIAIEYLTNEKELHSLSYSELTEAVALFSIQLTDSGVNRQDYVIVHMGKSIELYIAILALWNIGAIYTPVDLEGHHLRVQSVIEETGSEVCIVRQLSSSLHEFGIRNIVFDNYQNLEKYQGWQDIRYEVKGDEFAYAIFTSGSTGKPKGVLCSHSNVVNNIATLASIYSSKSGNNVKISQFTSIGFDVSIFEIVYAFQQNCTLFSSNKEIVLSDISYIISRYEITHLSLTPTVASLLDPQFMKTVKLLILAGESISESLVREWRSLDCTIVQAYGPTEMTNVCTVFYDFTEGFDPLNIGKCLLSCSAMILNPEGQILPKGSVGELCFGGFQVAKGYVNVTDQTKVSFVNHQRAGRIYKTGDYARIFQDDCIQFLGRVDQQVKIRGQRVELDEINCMLKMLFIDSFTIFEANQIISFVISKDRSGIDGKKCIKIDAHMQSLIESAEQDLRNSLPEYMIPSSIIPLSNFPVNSNGKVNRKELLLIYKEYISHYELYRPASISTNNLIANANATERTIAEALSEVVAIPIAELRLSESFVRYGLNSLSAIKFSSALRSKSINVSLYDIIKQSSIKKLASICGNVTHYIDTTIGRQKINEFSDFVLGRLPSNTKFDASNVERILPCTPLQEGLLASGSYTNSFVFGLAPHVDKELLREAWRTMSQNRDLLRTSFLSIDNVEHSFAQIVLKSYDLQWNEYECSEEVTTYKIDEYMKSLKLETITPPYRLAIFYSAQSCYLVASLHHAL